MASGGPAVPDGEAGFVGWFSVPRVVAPVGPGTSVGEATGTGVNMFVGYAELGIIAGL